MKKELEYGLIVFGVFEGHRTKHDMKKLIIIKNTFCSILLYKEPWRNRGGTVF